MTREAMYTSCEALSIRGVHSQGQIWLPKVTSERLGGSLPQSILSQPMHDTQVRSCSIHVPSDHLIPSLAPSVVSRPPTATHRGSRARIVLYCSDKFPRHAEDTGNMGKFLTSRKPRQELTMTWAPPSKSDRNVDRALLYTPFFVAFFHIRFSTLFSLFSFWGYLIWAVVPCRLVS